MFEKCKEKLFKLLAFIHLLQNQAVTFGKRKEQVVCMNFKILMWDIACIIHIFVGI